jgi:hypothetical protein
MDDCMAVPHGAPSNSGLTSHSKAIEWARNYLDSNHKCEKVYIHSLDATASRSSPPIVVTPHSPGNEAEKPTIITAHSTGDRSPPVYTRDPIST